MPIKFVLLLLLLAPSLSFADPPGDCAAGQGHFMTGVVVSTPKFADGKLQKGVELSHTHFTIRSDQDHQAYDVAADNVFAAGYDSAHRSIPAPLTQIRTGLHVELCGKLYSTGDGIDWVHTNCGITSTPDKPDGWLRILPAGGGRSDNLEGATKYCTIF